MLVTQKHHNTGDVCAVLMGDLVQSTQVADVAKLHKAFNLAIRRHNRTAKADILSPLKITLGDEFQGLITTLVAGAALMRSIRFEPLREAFECRFALGVARIETGINTATSWNMMGPGLAETRFKLNEKKDGSRYGFSLYSHPALEIALDAIGSSLTSVEKNWTKTQRHDIVAQLSGQGVDDIARARNVKAHTVYKVRDAGDFDFYTRQWTALHKVLGQVDAELGLER